MAGHNNQMYVSDGHFVLNFIKGSAAWTWQGTKLDLFMLVSFVMRYLE